MLGSFVVLLISNTSCFLTTLHLPCEKHATCQVVRKDRLNIICTGRGGGRGGRGEGGRGDGRGKERRPSEEGNIKNWVGGRERLGYGKGWREEREMAVISLKGIKEEKKTLFRLSSLPFTGKESLNVGVSPRSKATNLVRAD